MQKLIEWGGGSADTPWNRVVWGDAGLACQHSATVDARYGETTVVSTGADAYR